MKRNSAYKDACKAALAYKNGYIHENDFKNILGNYICYYISEKFMQYSSDTLNRRILAR